MANVREELALTEQGGQINPKLSLQQCSSRHFLCCAPDGAPVRAQEMEFRVVESNYCFVFFFPLENS